MTKDNTFSRGGGSKIQSVSTNRLTGSSHIKALFKAVCFCVLLACLLACLSPGWIVFLRIAFCRPFGKHKDIITPCHRGSGSTRWSPGKRTWRAERGGRAPVCVWAQMRENCCNDWKSLQVDSTWPSLVSMVLMRTFLVVVVSIWGLESIIVSEKEKMRVVLSTGNKKQ